MGLFKSTEERRMERDMKIRSGLKKVQRQIRSLEKDEKAFIAKAKKAKQLGDKTQLNFLKANLKRTAATRRLMERQMLNMETFAQLKNQAETQAEFARNLDLIAGAISESFGSVNLPEIHKNCEKAVGQYEKMEQMMEMFMESQAESIGSLEGSQSDELISDKEIDALIDDQIVTEENKEIESAVGSRLEALKARMEKHKDKA
jgi:hypothetical protein